MDKTILPTRDPIPNLALHRSRNSKELWWRRTSDGGEMGSRHMITHTPNFKTSIKNCLFTLLGHELLEGLDDFIPPRQHRFDFRLVQVWLSPGVDFIKFQFLHFL